MFIVQITYIYGLYKKYELFLNDVIKYNLYVNLGYFYDKYNFIGT